MNISLEYTNSREDTDSLAALEARIARDLDAIAHPNQAWLPERLGPDGKRALDVLVVGAGQSGIAAAFGLTRSAVTNVLVVDAAPEGREGPWTTYARMPNLRSPKELTGPDLDIPSLTYRSWHEAKYGEAHWQALVRIPKGDWNDYLLFVRRVTGLKVENNTEVTDLAPADGGLIAATLVSSAGTRVVYARKVLLATGQDGVGTWWMPPMLARLPTHLRAHAADSVDFAALKGKRVAVIGAGASAFDNAATALEAGAVEVHLFCRRAEIQTIQPYRWLTFRGFLAHLSEMSDEWRWRFMSYIL
ncbi:MAG: NAD(P)/FAD-dependent oxidoreductase, partial [Alphaproteobacteria bacterium]